MQSGLESFVIKYGKVFSAMQFLLSSDRDNYVQAQELFVRFCIAHYAFLFLIATLQLHNWLETIASFREKQRRHKPLVQPRI